VFETGAIGDALVAELSAASRAVSVGTARLLTAIVGVFDATPVREHAAAEVAAALRLTPRASATQVSFALDVMRRLPALGAAMARGDLDASRARVIADGVSTLEAPAARQVAEKVLPKAMSLTTGQLRAWVAKLVIAIDPETAAKRHLQRVEERRVVLEPSLDGCANLLGMDLPADEALRASRNINKLARSLKAAGDPRSMDQLRADTFVRLLCGQSTGRGSVELVVSLSALAELTRNPGTLAGYGPVVAEIARKVAAAQADGKWTYTARDPETGQVLHGPLRARPGAATPPSARPGAPDPGGAGADSPKKTAASPPSPRTGPANGRPGSGGAAGDSAAGPDGAGGSPGGVDGSAARGARGDSPEKGGTGPGASGSGENTRRPGARLRREIIARDRTCRAPGCRVPATSCDFDHGISWASGGRTTAGNLTPLCKYHHRVKHEAGWRYRRLPNGVIIWRSPLGQIYRTYPETDDEEDWPP
jgi:hypothetical protein